MNKLLTIIFISIFILTTSCKKMDLEGLSMGVDKQEVMNFINTNNMELLPDEEDGYIRAEGNFRLLGFKWNRMKCQFDNDRLVFIGMERPLEDVSEMMLQYINTDFEEKFGEMASSAKHQLRMFGNGKDNKHGYTAAYQIDKYENRLYLMIKDEDAPKNY